MHETVMPIKGYISPSVLLVMAAREFDRAKMERTWAPDVEREAHQKLAGRYYREAFDQYWAMRR